MQPSPGLRVLVVDDEPLIRWALSEALGRVGHNVTEAGDARETLVRLTDSLHPDVVVLDYRLPDSNDLSLLQAVRRAVPEAAVIMMTAFGTQEFIDGARDLGVFTIVNKPFELGDLVSMVPAAYASHPH